MKHIIIRECKNLWRLWHQKHHFKIELAVGIYVLWLLHVGHIVQNGWNVLSSDWHNNNIGFHVKAENKRLTTAGSQYHQNLKVENFTLQFDKLHQLPP